MLFQKKINAELVMFQESQRSINAVSKEGALNKCCSKNVSAELVELQKNQR